MSTSSLAIDHTRNRGLSAEQLAAIRADFPVLARQVHGHPLVYLDNAATAQKPAAVITAITEAYSRHYANVHRGVHALSQESTDAFEAARRRIASFLGAAGADEIVFTRGATESINLVASSFGRSSLKAGDEIILTEMEHHANIVPWQLLRDEKGVVLKVVPFDDRGVLRLDRYHEMLTPRTRLVAITHVSNALGTINPVREMAAAARERGAVVLIDGCQAVPHLTVDVRALGADFYVFSSHKLYGPTGVGVLYGRRELLERMPPYQGGGEMILSVDFDRCVFKKPPHRFEAGTPAFVEAIGLAAAIDYLDRIGRARIAEHEQALADYACERLRTVPGLRLIGEAPDKAPIHSFVMAGAHPHDIGTILDRHGIAIRAGHHCAQPIMRHFAVAATARASFAVYNTFDEVDALIDGLHAVRKLFS